MTPALRLLPNLLLFIGLFLPAGSLFAQPDAESLKRTVIHITQADHDEQVGTGFLVGARAGRWYAVTAAHVLTGMTSGLRVVLYDRKGIKIPAQIESTDPVADVAVVSFVPPTGVAAPQPGQFRQQAVTELERVRVVGCPVPNEWIINGLNEVSEKEIDYNPRRFGISPLGLREGFSGSPVRSSDGQILGMLVSVGNIRAVAVTGSFIQDLLTKWGTPMAFSQSQASITPAPPVTQGFTSYEHSLAGAMVAVKGGTFQMGSNEGESDEKPVHSVTVGDFWMGKYEVTVREFAAFVSATGYKTDAEKGGNSWVWLESSGTWEEKSGVNWRHDAEGNVRPQSAYNHPVIHVSWNDAVAYCKWVSEKTGHTYRLPTEAEWEYAAGNGAKHTKYSWGNGLPSGKQGGNVADETAKQKFSGWTIFDGYTDGYVYTAPVGQFNANDLGLHDMTGNVWEWCGDWYGSDYYASSPSNNPKGPASGASRVRRGGGWGSDPVYCRVAYRSYCYPSDRNNNLGFRLARQF